MSEHCGQVTHHTKRRGKLHPCDWCGQTIEPGGRYATWLYFCDGARSTVYAHAECYDVWVDAESNDPGGIVYADGGCDRPKGGKEVAG